MEKTTTNGMQTFQSTKELGEQFLARMRNTCAKCGYNPCRCAEIAAREADYKRMEARLAKEEEARKKAALAKRLGGLRALEDFTADKYTNKDILKALSGYPYGNYFLWGNAGIGKTHAAVAVLRNVPNAYVFRLSEISRRFRASLEVPDEREQVRFFSSCYMLLDDLGSEKITDYLQSILFEIIDNRWQNRQSGLIITSNVDIASLGQLVGDKIVSRIVGLCGQKNLLHITGKDRRLG